MARFTGVAQVTSGNALAMWTLASTATVRAKMAHIQIASPASPANNAGDFNVDRFTVAPTGGTTVTPRRVSDPGAVTVSALTALKGTYSGQPTLGDILLMPAVNQQATYQWWSNPYYEPESAVGTANGLCMQCVAYNTGAIALNFTWAWEE